ncbi:MAG: hypothetical protein QM766_12820 [Burkholderiaceae bacterium]
MLTKRFLAVLLSCVPLAVGSVTLSGDPAPHLWHSFDTPDNAFGGRTAQAWRNDDPGTLYAEWGGFAREAGAAWTFVMPTVGIGPTTSVVLRETSRTGLLTGSGNIYGLAGGQVPGAPLVFELTVTENGAAHSASEVRTVAMRIGTKGVLPNLVATLNGVDATAINTFRVDGTIEMPVGEGGALDNVVTSDAEWLWLWNDVPATATAYRFDFRASVGHMSLDNLAVHAGPPRSAASSSVSLPASASVGATLAGLIEAEIETLTTYVAAAPADGGLALDRLASAPRDGGRRA